MDRLLHHSLLHQRGPFSASAPQAALRKLSLRKKLEPRPNVESRVSAFYDSIAYSCNKQNGGDKNDRQPISEKKIEKTSQPENEKTTYRKIVHFDLRSAIGTRRLAVRNEFPAFVAFA